ncbi:MAG: M67 family metallopeptidase [Flavobacteriales bacterium]|nr:M67 family metallopeptidase [Flavobacteriales bacterium]
MKEVKFTDTALQEMHEHLVASYPHEGCGFFYGKINENKEVTEIRDVVNQNKTNPERIFEIAPIDYVKAERYAIENDLDLIGVYHSHPDHPAVPSPTDLKFAQPNFSYVIVSIVKGEVAATSSWTLNDAHKFIQEPVFDNEEKKVTTV